MNHRIHPRLKPYKVQELVFSCLRSRVAYDTPAKISSVFRKDGNRDILNCKLMNCNLNIRTKVDVTVNQIVDDMRAQPFFYDELGFMIWKSNTLYITFRGTKDPKDITKIVNIRPRQFIKDVYLHAGFLDLFLSIEPQLTANIRDIVNSYPIERLVFSGHSMGGSIATLAAAYYGSIFEHIFMTCHTFGSPVIGNLGFVQWYSDHVDESTRLEIEEDLVPLIPVNLNFHHVPHGAKLKKNEQVEYDYPDTFTNYTEIITRLFNTQSIYVNHSCEKYLERLIALKQIRRCNFETLEGKTSSFGL